MDLIPTWVRRLWDVWDLRVLVLLSFTLQLILSIFGNRRKYISSLWISVLVWSTYVTADWVATVALGKLSDGDPEKSNVLWAIWAPLLLLHLGGPDSITAYSLEDNQLWMRHLLGFVVQLFVAIYVILMSWENSWFSFISLPALVAGLIKYGERTWVLKLVSGDNYINCSPLAGLRGQYENYSGVLILAHNRLEEFWYYLRIKGLPFGDFTDLNRVDRRIWFDAAEVTMGFMYDLLYTKATIVHSKGGCILRCISFGCTMTVLVGLIFRILLSKSTREVGDEIDIAITGVLVAGALALEIYAAIVSFSSNWEMLWLIKQGRKEWVIWLSHRFPWLFNKKKNWSQTMGQFDLLGYCLKVSGPVQTQSSKIIRLVLGRDYEYKWNIYRHKTAYSVDPSVYKEILDDYKANISSIVSDSDHITARELAEFWAPFTILNTQPFGWKFGSLHLATEVCYQLEIEWDGGEDPSGSDYSLWKKNREVCKALSDYVMFLLIMHPSLLPYDGTGPVLETFFERSENLTKGARDKIGACHNWMETGFGPSRRIAEDLKRKGKVKRWEILKLMWWETLKTAVAGPKGFGQGNAHF